ncbi:3-oxoacyl-[acyl-carrier-protein] synthase III C-terminal domain-containing protein [Actinacidiphila sp. ITFR-21]
MPLAFAELVGRGTLPAGGPVLLLGFGGGMSCAGQVVDRP